MVATFVTTIDNPFDYWTQFDEWNAYDTQKGYNTCAYVARIALASNEMSENDYTQAINDAVDDILRLNILGIYKKTTDTKENTNEDEGEAEEIDEELEEV